MRTPKQIKKELKKLEKKTKKRQQIEKALNDLDYVLREDFVEVVDEIFEDTIFEAIQMIANPKLAEDDYFHSLRIISRLGFITSMYRVVAKGDDPIKEGNLPSYR